MTKLTDLKQLWLKENSTSFTSKELAEKLEVSVSLICQFCSKNKIKYLSEDRERFYTEEEQNILFNNTKTLTIKELSVLLNNRRTGNSIRNFCNKHELDFIDGHTNLLVNHNFLDEINIPEKAYFLGWFHTDGHLDVNKNRIEFGLTDKSVLELFNKILGCDQKIRLAKKVSETHKSLYKWSVSSPRLSTKLQELGYTNTKTFTANYPVIPEELEWHFLRGCLDGDGSLYINKQIGHKPLLTMNLVGTKNLLENCKLKFGFSNKIIKVKNVFCHSISGKFAVEILTKVYANSQGLRLTRKYDIFINYLKSRDSLTPELELSFNSLIN